MITHEDQQKIAEKIVTDAPNRKALEIVKKKYEQEITRPSRTLNARRQQS